MFVRLFKADGSYADGELEYRDLGTALEEQADGTEATVQKYEMTFKEGLPQGILPTAVMRLEFEEDA